MEDTNEVKKGKGGAREGAGRKRVVDEQKANQLFVDALKELKKVDTDDEAKKKFIKGPAKTTAIL